MYTYSFTQSILIILRLSLIFIHPVYNIIILKLSFGGGNATVSFLDRVLVMAVIENLQVEDLVRHEVETCGKTHREVSTILKRDQLGYSPPH